MGRVPGGCSIEKAPRGGAWGLTAEALEHTRCNSIGEKVRGMSKASSRWMARLLWGVCLHAVFPTSAMALLLYQAHK
jgi:hypothetical protein